MFPKSTVKAHCDKEVKAPLPIITKSPTKAKLSRSKQQQTASIERRSALAEKASIEKTRKATAQKELKKSVEKAGGWFNKEAASEIQMDEYYTTFKPTKRYKDAVAKSKSTSSLQFKDYNANKPACKQRSTSRSSSKSAVSAQKTRKTPSKTRVSEEQSEKRN